MNEVIKKIKDHPGLLQEWNKFLDLNLYTNTFSIVEDFLLDNPIQKHTWEFLNKKGTKEGRNEMALYIVDLLIDKLNESHSN